MRWSSSRLRGKDDRRHKGISKGDSRVVRLDVEDETLPNLSPASSGIKNVRRLRSLGRGGTDDVRGRQTTPRRDNNARVTTRSKIVRSIGLATTPSIPTLSYVRRCSGSMDVVTATIAVA